MNNFHIYEEIGRGDSTVVYKVRITKINNYYIIIIKGKKEKNNWIYSSKKFREKQKKKGIKWCQNK